MSSKRGNTQDAREARNPLMKQLAELPATPRARARARADRKPLGAREAIAAARPAVAPGATPRARS